jgi:hypothetical protein
MSKSASTDNVAGGKCAGLTLDWHSRLDMGDKIYSEPTKGEGQLYWIEPISTDNCRLTFA